MVDFLTERLLAVVLKVEQAWNRAQESYPTVLAKKTLFVSSWQSDSDL
jgi:hypothetical protein